LKSERQHREEICRFGKLLHERGYVAATDGNLSVRLGDGNILVTPTGMCKSMMEADDMVVVDLDGRQVSGRRGVTSEIGMHLLIYRMRPDIQAVVHAHPPTATGFAACGQALDQPLVSEIVVALGCVPLAKYGTPAQQAQWLRPLLDGQIRSSFAMTEPEVASSDATNIGSIVRRDGSDYVINGRKWYTTGATDPRCKIIIFMGKTDPDSPDRHRQQSMILVPLDTPGVRVLRPLPVFGFYGVPDRASEVVFENVRVPVTNVLLGEGRGFEIAQGRLGPGRIHHCMRLIGMCERVLERMCRRAEFRTAFGRTLAQQTVTLERIAEARIAIEQTRLLTLKAAAMMDKAGNKAARAEIAMIKVAAPLTACRIVDWAMQAYGGGGTGNDHFLTAAYATARLLRLADGPDEVHRNQIGRMEVAKHAATDPARTGGSGDVLPLEEVEREFAHLRPGNADYLWGMKLNGETERRS